MPVLSGSLGAPPLAPVTIRHRCRTGQSLQVFAGDPAYAGSVENPPLRVSSREIAENHATEANTKREMSPLFLTVYTSA